MLLTKGLSKDGEGGKGGGRSKPRRRKKKGQIKLRHPKGGGKKARKLSWKQQRYKQKFYACEQELTLSFPTSVV